jgi:hypothetical protein
VRSVLTVIGRRCWLDDGFEADLRVTLKGVRWWRIGLFLGPPPGSHMGFWQTRAWGLRGWNYRWGTFGNAITVLAHTRADD